MAGEKVAAGTNTSRMYKGFMLPDPRMLTPDQLRNSFVDLSHEFSERLTGSLPPSEISELEVLQQYLKDLAAELEIKDKSKLKSL